MNSIIRLDTRGRLVIPNEFRENLDLKEGDEVLLSLDSKTNTLIISPIYVKQSDLVRIEVEFKDVPGCLAKIAEKLAKMKIDLIMTESKSFQRGKKARWDIIGDISKCQYSFEEIKNSILVTNYGVSMTIQRIARGGLHQ